MPTWHGHTCAHLGSFQRSRQEAPGRPGFSISDPVPPAPLSEGGEADPVAPALLLEVAGTAGMLSLSPGLGLGRGGLWGQNLCCCWSFVSRLPASLEMVPCEPQSQQLVPFPWI